VADIAYRSAATSAGSTTATQPSGVQPGDLVIVLVSTARPDAAPIVPTAPAGWTYVADSHLTFESAGFWQGSSVFWAYHTAALSYTFTLDPNKGGEHFNVIAIANPAASNPIQGAWQQLITTATTSFAVTPDVTDQSRMLAVAFADGRTTAGHNPGWSAPSGFSERLEANGGCIDTAALDTAGDGGTSVAVTPSEASIGAIYVLLVYGASSVPATLDVAGSHVSSTLTLHAGAAGLTLTGAHQASTASQSAGAVGPVMAGAHRASTAQLHAGTAGQGVSGAHRASSLVLSAGVLGGGLAGAHRASTLSLHAGRVATIQALTGAHLASTLVLHTGLVLPGEIAGSHRASSLALHAGTISQGVEGAFRSTTARCFPGSFLGAADAQRLDDFLVVSH
jgi:hypothetical protein